MWVPPPSHWPIVALGDQIGRAPEVEVGKSRPKVCHERRDVFAAAARFVQGILQEHIGRRDLIDNSKIDVLAPEFGEPANDDGLVVFFFTHGNVLFQNRATIETAR
ncbi:hypothetical protein N183_14535 [Sinorhizobium sp. Sb3]|nr:hypothetical protein N183_14535 [Sinorhizobium sp. Sb3]